MLNRYELSLYVKYFFDHLKDFDSVDCYNYIKNTNALYPDDLNEELRKVYYEILLNNKNINLDEQIEIVKIRIKEFKEYLINNNLMEAYFEVRLTSIEDIVLPMTIDYLTKKRFVREVRKGYK